MLKTLREAYYFSRHQFQPLLLIALFYAVPSYFIDLSLINNEEQVSTTYINVALIVSMCLSVIQFGAAMIYIDAISHDRAVTVPNAILQAAKQIVFLATLNMLMGIIVGIGFLFLVIPGIFLAYKLLFSELYLLLHNQDPINALKSSYKATTGFSTELLPPLLVWGALLIGGWKVGSLLIDPSGDSAWLTALIQQTIMMLLSIFGWALIYRLYQRYLEGQIPD